MWHENHGFKARHGGDVNPGSSPDQHTYGTQCAYVSCDLASFPHAGVFITCRGVLEESLPLLSLERNGPERRPTPVQPALESREFVRRFTASRWPGHVHGMAW